MVKAIIMLTWSNDETRYLGGYGMNVPNFRGFYTYLYFHISRNYAGLIDAVVPSWNFQHYTNGRDLFNKQKQTTQNMKMTEILDLSTREESLGHHVRV